MNTHSHYVLFITVYLLVGSTHYKQAFVNDRVQSTDERVCYLQTCELAKFHFASSQVIKFIKIETIVAIETIEII